MTPQSNFMILAPILAGREVKLRELLDSMNYGPGRTNPHNELIPFAALEELHFARLLVLDDKTTGDIGVYHRPAKTYPLYFAFLGDMDGDADSFRAKLAQRAAPGLTALFSCCEGFDPSADLAAWMKAHEQRPVAAYVNCRGRTVRQVREEAALFQAVEEFLDRNATDLRTLTPRELHANVRRYLKDEQAAGRLRLSEPEPTPVDWQIRNLLHLVGWPLLVLIVSPLLLLVAPLYLALLRRLETTDPEVCPNVDQTYSENLSQSEDHDVTNQFGAMGTLKPGFIRLVTTVAVLGTVDWAARHLVRPGRLGRIRSIHFARWAFVAGTERMIFFSNYDGSVESYMDDFINKTGFGLNASFSNGIGYPRTNWLVLDGCQDERKYKEFLRRHTLPTQVWYKAYPGLTAVDLERNTRLRHGLEAAALNEEQAREWIALL